MKQDPIALLQQLNTLQTQVLELAATSNLSPMPAIGDKTTLEDLKTLLKQLASSSPAGSREKALATLDRFLSLAHQDFADFQALEQYKTQVREFRHKIASMSDTQMPADVQNLAQGRHPIAMILKLIEQSGQLDDRQWAQMTEVVAKSFGQTIAVAVSRGKLVVRKEASTSTPPTPAASTPSTTTTTTATSPQPAASPKSDVFIWGEDPKSSPATAPVATKSPIVFGAKSLGLEEPAPPAATTPATTNIPLKVLVHIQGIGDREFGAREFAGTRGQSKGVEGFSIEFVQPMADVQLEYMAHLADVGDTPWLAAGQFLGTRGENRRMEGFAIRLSGAAADGYRVCYTAHIQNVGDSPILSDGKYCGTRQKSLKIEALKVWVEPKI